MYIKYYKIADITVEVRSDLPITEKTFHSKFKEFESNGPSDEMAVIHHHFSGIPKIPVDRNNPLYLRPPWAIFEKNGRIIYEWIKPEPPFESVGKKVIANEEHSHLDIFHDDSGSKTYLDGALESLAMFPTDQIWLGHLLAHRSGCIIHSLGIILDGNGYLFVGHSSAGKSTMAKILMNDSIILCDDRNIIRKCDDGFSAYGTWSHGDVPNISPGSAPLKGIFFLQKSNSNKLSRLRNNLDGLKILLACLIRPLATTDWWNRSIDLFSEVLETTPCWTLHFDKSGAVLDLLRKFNSDQYKETV